MNEVVAASAPILKSKPKALEKTRTLRKQEIVEDGASELGIDDEPEDDTKEREAALASPMKGKESRQLNAVRFIYCSQAFLIIVVDSNKG